MSSAPQVTHVVILNEEETEIAAVAVRKYLGRLRHQYRQDKRNGNRKFMAKDVERFDDALDLYERLGGNPDEVPDIEDKP